MKVLGCEIGVGRVISHDGLHCRDSLLQDFSDLLNELEVHKEKAVHGWGWIKLLHKGTLYWGALEILFLDLYGFLENVIKFSFLPDEKADQKLEITLNPVRGNSFPLLYVEWSKDSDLLTYSFDLLVIPKRVESLDHAQDLVEAPIWLHTCLFCVQMKLFDHWVDVLICFLVWLLDGLQSVFYLWLLQSLIREQR